MLIRITRIALVVAAGVGLGGSDRELAIAGTAASSDGASTVAAADAFGAQARANRRPVLKKKIGTQRATEDKPFRYPIPPNVSFANLFTDPDRGDHVTVKAVSNASWLSADKKSRKVTGTPQTYANPAVVTLTATDGHGGRTIAKFKVTVTPKGLADDTDPEQSTPSLPTDGTEDSTQPSISTNGRFVAHLFNMGLTESSVVVRDFTSSQFSGPGSFTVGGPLSEFAFSSPSISGDGRLVSFVGETPPDAVTPGVEVKVVRIAQGNPLKLATKFLKFFPTSDEPGAQQILVSETAVFLSADGHFVAFEDGTSITVAKIGTAGRLTIDNASNPRLSGNGRRLAYKKVTDATEREIQVAFIDTSTMTVTTTVFFVGVDNSDDFAAAPAVLSTNGRFVAFESDDSTLVDGDTNGRRDIFVVNLDTLARIRVNLDADGDQADSDCFHPSLSRDGSRIAFDTSVASTGAQQVLVRDLDADGSPVGELRIASVNGEGVPGNIGGEDGNPLGSSRPALSADGRFVAFESTSTNLTPDASENKGIAVFLVPAFPDDAPVVDFPPSS